ncbi:MAG: fumarylacetoacetate hydrolase family protein [Proteobacteria bacterium]|nr:fumarylacetoacetate hydrolase family protein [Pseudomonadota bacterium]MBI3497987.1 fumarylacetoacetate hydrolase family protein [Pseudomonadota bacterium]
MKLASLKLGGRDGTLVVVDRTLTRAVPVPDIAPTLQRALEDWGFVAAELRSVYRLLDHDQMQGAFPFDPAACASPLPRAYQWADGSAYLNHVELVRRARGAEMPKSFLSDPLMYQGGSDYFLGPRDPILAGSEEFGIDFEAEVAVIVDDVPMGIGAAVARSRIKLVMLANDVSLRNLIPGELAKGFGFFHGKPPTAFSPVAVEPSELGAAWDGGKLSLPLLSHLNGKEFGHPNAGVDMNFDFPRLIQHAALTRPLGAGTIIGSGTVSNRDPAAGYACVAEKRTVETLESGKPVTPFLKFGDVVRIEMLDGGGRTIFGAIEQTVAAAMPVR